MNAVIYARFSSSMQNETSIDAQVRACREYAQKNHITIKKIYSDEAVSGKTTNRVNYQKMMSAAKNHAFDIILIHKYDRIARNLGDHINLASRLQDLGIELIAVSQDFGDGKEGKLMRSIQWVLSEYYIDNLAEEVRKGLKEVALKGKHPGGIPPFGYDIIDGDYVINPVEASYVQKMYNLVLQGKGYTELIKEMAEAGIVGKRGKPLDKSSIYELLHQEKYTGTLVYSLVKEKGRSRKNPKKKNALRVEGAIPTIIERETWQKVQDIMQERSRKHPNASYWCSGLVYCGRCMSKMHVQKIIKSSGKEYFYYVCRGHCGMKYIDMNIIDSVAQQYIDEVFSKENRKAIEYAIKKYNENEDKMLKDFEEGRSQKLKVKQSEYDSLYANLSSAALPKTVVEEIGAKMELLLREIEHIKKVEPIRDFSHDIIDGWLDDILTATHRELPKILIDKIIVNDDTIEIISTFSRVVQPVGNEGVEPTFPLLLFSCIVKRQI